MFGSVRINLILAGIAFLFVLAISLTSNTIQTSLFRSFLALIITFFLSYGLRFAISFILDNKHVDNNIHNQNSHTSKKEGLVQNSERNTANINDAQNQTQRINKDETIEEELPEDVIKKTSDFVKDLIQDE